MTDTHVASILRGSVISLILLLCAGCSTSNRVYTPRKDGFFGPARVSVVPTGTTVTLRVRGAGIDPSLRGELIEVRVDGFLILTETTSLLTLVPYDRMTRMRFGNDVGISRSINGNRSRGIPPMQQDSVRQTALARFSRYPFGLKDAQLQRLLEALGQAELVVMGSR